MSSDPREVRGFQLLQTALARAVEDDDYRQRLISDPKPVLREAGLEVSDEIEVVVHENEPSRMHLVLPSRPRPWDEFELHEVDAAHLLEMLH
jgi:hypothetical protein